MIRKLQKRFIRIAVMVLTAAMVLVVGIVNTVNLISVRRELQDTLGMLAESGLPGDMWGSEDFGIPVFRLGDRSRHSANLMNESSWFSIRINTKGEIRNKNLAQMGDLEEDAAESLARQALESGKTSGWIQDYCFLIREEDSHGDTVVVLNGETRMTAVRTLALISCAACAGGILLSWILVKVFSRKAVDPIIRNMEQQKRFITDASHELKTPLTVISTNMELLKMEHPDNQWVRSTQKQTGNLRRLVDELVYLSRMEEENPALNMESLAVASLLRETAEPFQAMAEFSGKEMAVEAEEGLHITGDRPSIQRMISTLCDNAVKYTPEGGSILAEASEEGKNAVIRVSNTVESPLTKEQCEQQFNLFYRADASRNKEKKSGFGIGLSIAAAIAEKHGGSMKARMEGEKLVISATIPRERRTEAADS